jgi:F-type H+-transporting ATPase subunit a
MKNIFFIKYILLLIVFAFAVNNAKAETHESHGDSTKKLDVGALIMDHVLDAHDWHILSYGKFHLTLPLPVIVYSQNSGLHVFMSSKFHHGHETHKGFAIDTIGELKGKIYEVNADGSPKMQTLQKDGKPIEEVVMPLDFSITKNVLALFVSLTLLLWIFISVANKYKNSKKAPTGLQNALEPLILFIRDDIAKPAIGEKKYEKYIPYLLTVFFFIFLNNLMGLIPILPGGANLTGNIAVTMVLAVFTFIITTRNANKNYWTHIFNAPGVPWWLKYPIPLMPLVEVIGVFTKPFVLMVRLFANITAGHIIVLGFFSLIFIFGEMSIGVGYGISVVSIAFTIFMSILELLVAFIQAYVFTLLSALYFGMATEEHHH